MGEVEKINFKGEIAGSKSLLNRALIVKSFFPELKIVGDSSSQDVENLRRALSQWQVGGSDFHCGDGGTTFRFLMARLSRASGIFRLQGSPRLLGRPHLGLIQSLQSLGVNVETLAGTVSLQSSGWQVPGCLKMDMAVSSQFVSAILLSAWQLSENLSIELSKVDGSWSYLQMTIDFLKALGMNLELSGNQIFVPKNQVLEKFVYTIEPDMSSAFTVAAAALAGGRAEIFNFPDHAIQPDFYFIEMLKRQGAKIEWNNHSLVIRRSVLQAGSFELVNNPDLFPVLALLLLKAHGVSSIRGVNNLVFKESNRIANTQKLIRQLGGVADWDGQIFTIEGQPNLQFKEKIVFDPDHDHRMAMAAAVAMAYGADVEVIHPQVVEKSFPHFWKVLNL